MTRRRHDIEQRIISVATIVLIAVTIWAVIKIGPL